MSLVPLFALQEPPLFLFALHESVIIVVNQKSIVTYTQSSKSAEFILSEPIKQVAIHSYYLFILYECNRIQRRQLFSWEEPIILATYDDQITSIKAENQNKLIVNFSQHLDVIEINSQKVEIRKVSFPQNIDIKDICCFLQNQGKTTNLCYLLQQPNTISQYTIDFDQIFEIKTSHQKQTIIFITAIRYPLLFPFCEYSPNYLLTINKLLQISIYNIFDEQFVPKVVFNLRQLVQNIKQNVDYISVYFNEQTRGLFIQVDDILVRLQFRNRLPPLAVSIVNQFIGHCKVITQVKGKLIGTNKQGAIILNNLNVNLVQIKIDVEENKQTKQDIMKQKQMIQKQIKGYSKEAEEKMKQLQPNEEQKSQIQKQFKDTVNGQQFQQQKSCPIIQNSQMNISKQYQYMLTNNQSQTQIQNQYSNQITYKSIETQTDYFEDNNNTFDIPQLQQQILSHVSKFQSVLQQQMAQFYKKTQQEISTFQLQILKTIHTKMQTKITKQIQKYMSQLFAPKLQKYLNLTFNKLNDIVQIGHNLHLQQIRKEHVKFDEVNRHVIENNKEMLVKIVNIVKMSVGKFEEKKQEMISDFEAKSNLLNDLVFQSEDMVKKMEEKSKQNDVNKFEQKIYELIEEIQEGLNIIKTKENKELQNPPILETMRSNISNNNSKTNHQTIPNQPYPTPSQQPYYQFPPSYNNPLPPAYPNYYPTSFLPPPPPYPSSPYPNFQPYFPPQKPYQYQHPSTNNYYPPK